MSIINDEKFVIILLINRPPIYKDYSFVEGKNGKSIKFSLNLPKSQVLAIRTPTFIQRIASSIVITDICPYLIRNNRFDFSCALQVIDKTEAGTISFIFKSITTIVRVIDNRKMELPGIDMPDFVVKFASNELCDFFNNNKTKRKKIISKFISDNDDKNQSDDNNDNTNNNDSDENSNDKYQNMKGNEFILQKIATSFELDHEKPQVFINNVDLLNINEDPITIINKYMKGYHNTLVFKCALTPKALNRIDNRIRAIKELVDTECSFLENFLFLTGYFPPKMRERIAPLMKKKDDFQKFEEYFKVAESVLKFHSSVLGVFNSLKDYPKLQHKQISSLSIDDPLALNLYKVLISLMFFEIGEKFVIDRKYMKSFREIQPFLSVLKGGQIDKVLHEIESGVFKKQKLTFESYAIVPFQRPLKYPDLLRAIIQYTPKSHIDYSFLIGTLNYMKEICSKLEKYVDEIHYTLEKLTIFNRVNMENVNFDNLNLTDNETIKLQLLEKNNNLMSIFQIYVKNYRKLFKTKNRGFLYLFKERILLTVKNMLTSKHEETAIFFNKIHTQSFLIECDSSKLSILLTVDNISAPIHVFFEDFVTKIKFLSDLKTCRDALFVKYIDKELNFSSTMSVEKSRIFTHTIFAEEIVTKCMLKIAAPPMYNISGCILGQMMYFAGGTLNAKDSNERNNSPLVMFDSKSFGCYYHQSVVTPNANMRMALAKVNEVPTIFLVGGSTKSKVLVFGDMKWEENPGEPIARTFHSCVSYNDQYLVVFGGINEKNRPTNELLKYDIMKHSWNRPNCTCKSPCCRINHSCVVFKNTMIIHGGEFNGDKLHDTWVFNFGADTNINMQNNPNGYRHFHSEEWAEVDLGPNNSCFPRSGHAAVIVNDHFMVVFGGDNNENKPFAVDLFSWEVINFEIKGNFFLGMNKFAAIYNKLDKKIYCFGGENHKPKITLNNFVSLTLPNFLFESYDKSLMLEKVKFDVNIETRKCRLVKRSKAQDLRNEINYSISEFIHPLNKNNFIEMI